MYRFELFKNQKKVYEKCNIYIYIYIYITNKHYFLLRLQLVRRRMISDRKCFYTSVTRT
jgi:hypothetical protein